MSAIYETKGRAREYCELAVNLYRGCGHGCTYCYGAAVTRVTREAFADGVPRTNIVNQIAHDALAMKARGDDRPVLFCFVTDCYQPVEEKFRITRAAIVAMHEAGRKVWILTKAGPLATRDFDLLGPGDAFATTLTCPDDKATLEWEPHAGSPSERMANLMEAHRRGIRTWVSLEPVLQPSWSLEMITKTHEFVDHYKVGTLNYDPHAETIDWGEYGRAAVALLDGLGKDYYLKKDLREKMAI